MCAIVLRKPKEKTQDYKKQRLNFDWELNSNCKIKPISLLQAKEKKKKDGKFYL